MQLANWIGEEREKQSITWRARNRERERERDASEEATERKKRRRIHKTRTQEDRWKDFTVHPLTENERHEVTSLWYSLWIRTVPNSQLHITTNLNLKQLRAKSLKTYHVKICALQGRDPIHVQKHLCGKDLHIKKDEGINSIFPIFHHQLIQVELL